MSIQVSIFDKLMQDADRDRNNYHCWHKNVLKWMKILEANKHLFPGSLERQSRWDAYPTVAISASSPYKAIITIYIPWDVKLADKISIDLINVGWEYQEDCDRLYDNGQRKEYKFTHPALPKCQLDLTLIADIDGATCERVEIGREVREVIQYEVRCNGENI